MKLGHKLPLGFAAIVLLVVSAALFAMYRLNQAIAVYDTGVAGKVQSEHPVALFTRGAGEARLAWRQAP